MFLIFIFLYLKLNNSGTKYYDNYLILRNLVIYLIQIKVFEKLKFFIFTIKKYEAN